MKHVVILARILSIVLFAFSCVSAQQYEYGAPSELKGLTKVYVDTGPDIKNRDRIISMIAQAKTKLVLVDDIDNAEIMLTFGAGTETRITGANTNVIGKSAVTTVNRARLMRGQGLVAVQGKKNPEIPRILLSFASTRDRIWKAKPAKAFAKKFIKAWKEANSETN